VLRSDPLPGQIWLIPGREVDCMGGLYGMVMTFAWHFMLLSSRRARLS
jgi:hypothetical protein